MTRESRIEGPGVDPLGTYYAYPNSATSVDSNFTQTDVSNAYLALIAALLALVPSALLPGETKVDGNV